MFSHSAGKSEHTNGKNLFLFTPYQLLPWYNIALTSSHTYRDNCRAYQVWIRFGPGLDMFPLLCIIEWNYIESETSIDRYWLGRFKKQKQKQKKQKEWMVTDGYIPILNTEISSCHIFPKRAKHNSVCNSGAKRATTGQDQTHSGNTSLM